MHSALNSSVKMDWQTPESLLDLVRQVSSHGRIGLDPCTVASNPTGAMSICSPEVGVDGLVAQWTGNGGLIYVNPPYGRELPKWVTKCVEEAKRGAEIILLVPARPDTKWFQGAALAFTPPTSDANPHVSPAILFWRGRLKFKGAKDAAPFPSALFYWGPRVNRFREVFDGRGLFL